MNASYELRNGYLYVKVSGEFALAEVRGILSELLETARRHAMTRVLCDVTRVTGVDDELELTMTRFDVATLIAEALPKDIKFAVLETPRQISKDRFGENVMVNKGASAKEASTLDEALEWLGLTSANKSHASDAR